jgi:hypothetical protein
MADKRYRLNVDFDNSVLPFLYGGAGTWTFKVPSAPNFMGGRYVVFLPCVMVLTEVGKIPQISGFSRVEGSVPASGEFRTIEASNFEEYLLKDAIEFHSSAAGSTLTITNLWTMGSTVAPDIGDRYTDEKEGVDLFTGRGTGTNSHVTTGILYCSEGYCVVNGVEVVIDAVKTLTPTVELTTGYWYLVYLDSTGNFHFEITSNNTANIFPEAQVNTLAPVRSTKLGRYQVGNPDRRLIGCARASSGTLFHDKVYNLPEPTFGTGCLGNVELTGSGLGADATPLRGLDEAGEYHFDNLTINGLTYCGNTNGASCKPTVIRVRGTLTIGTDGQLNGTTRGKNGGAGGAGGTGTSTPGGAGGAGGKSGRPIFIYANRIINNRTSGDWLVCKGGSGNNGIGGAMCGGGGGFLSAGALLVVTNSSEVIGVNPVVYPDIAGGKGGNGWLYTIGLIPGGTEGCIGGVGGTPRSDVSTAFQPGGGSGGFGGGSGATSADGSGGTPGAGGSGTLIFGGGGGGGAGFHSTGTTKRHGGAGAPCAGGGGASSGTTAQNGQPGQPANLDFPIGYVTIIPSYSSRRGI